jgi:NADH-quinone oxidoreductase subunit C
MSEAIIDTTTEAAAPTAYAILQAKLAEKFGASVTNFAETFGMLGFETNNENHLKVMAYLKDELAFNFLTDITAVHYPDKVGAELAVVYHMHNLSENIRVRYTVYAPVAQPDVFTATSLFAGANWMERETFDFYGVNFVGHPNLKRVLNFPLRKEFPLEDQTRIDKDDAMFGR